MAKQADKLLMTELLATAAVTDEVGTRIRPGKLDRADTRPGIAVSLESERPVNHSTGALATTFSDVQIACIADTYDAARAVMDAARDCVSGYRSGTIRMCHVTDTTYAPGPAIRGEDAIREQFIINCLVQHT